MKRNPNSRPVAAPARPSIVVVTSGKGGVGKTQLVANLAVTLAGFGRKVVALDADYGLGKLDLVLGVRPPLTIESLLDGRAALGDVLVEGPAGVGVIAAASGSPDLAFLSAEQRGRLRAAIDALPPGTDVLLVDGATGISENVLTWLSWADRTIVVTSADPTAQVDAYAVRKLLGRLGARGPVHLVVNAVADEAEAREVHAQLELTARQFLGRGFDYLGHVVREPFLARTPCQGQPLVLLLPTSGASRCYRRLARRLDHELDHKLDHPPCRNAQRECAAAAR